MNNYTIGDLALLEATFAVNGDFTDPTTLTFKVKDPLNNETTYTMVRDSVGQYHYDLDLTNAAPGIWWSRVDGTGAAQGALEECFFVEPSNF